MTTESNARILLEHLGFQVEDIETSDKEESDFVATIAGCRSLVEEKTKIDDPARLRDRMEQLTRGEVYASHIPFVRDNRLSAIAKKAASQLASSSNQDHDFRLIWFTGAGVEAEAQYQQFVATLYGSTNIIERGATYYRRCYFYRNSDFFNHASVVDGAVVAHLHGTSISARLFLNPLSTRCGALRSSPVAAAFGTALEDPKALEAERTAFIVDSDTDRRDEQALLRYLESKYSTGPLMNIDIGHHSASIAVEL